MSKLDMASLSLELPTPDKPPAAPSTVQWKNLAGVARLPRGLANKPGKPKEFVNPHEDAELQYRIDEYFALCEERGKRPLITELALALGCSGPTELRRMGMRRPGIRRAISRAMTFVASHYEGMIGTVSGPGPIFMLKNIPDFDEYEPRGSTANYAFREDIQVDTGTRGAEDPRDRGRELSPREAYLQLIHSDTVIEADYEEVDEPQDLASKMDRLLDAPSSD
jgi:hypothetical protein